MLGCMEHTAACNTGTCSSSLPAPPACPWWLFSTFSVPAASLPSQRAQVAPASPSYDAHRQRSCGIAGRMCDPCGRHRFQWPGGRPCIGYSRLTTGEGMDRSTTATVQAASGRKWSEQRAQPGRRRDARTHTSSVRLSVTVFVCLAAHASQIRRSVS